MFSVLLVVDAVLLRFVIMFRDVREENYNREERKRKTRKTGAPLYGTYARNAWETKLR